MEGIGITTMVIFSGNKIGSHSKYNMYKWKLQLRSRMGASEWKSVREDIRVEGEFGIN
jgi:hypothetical protein